MGAHHSNSVPYEKGNLSEIPTDLALVGRLPQEKWSKPSNVERPNPIPASGASLSSIERSTRSTGQRACPDLGDMDVLRC
jgi:hypothetical protein